MKNSTIVIDPNICHGKPVFAGTRVMVWQVLQHMANGAKEKEILENFPTLTSKNIQDGLFYAGEVFSHENPSYTVAS